MNTSDKENPKLRFEIPESGDCFKNISFFEKNFEKKFEKFFLHRLADFGIFLAIFLTRKYKPKIGQKTFFSDVNFFG